MYHLHKPAQAQDSQEAQQFFGITQAPKFTNFWDCWDCAGFVHFVHQNS